MKGSEAKMLGFMEGADKARGKIGNIAFGDVAVTTAFELDARIVVHAVGPVWRDGQHGEEALLAQCY